MKLRGDGNGVFAPNTFHVVQTWASHYLTGPHSMYIGDPRRLHSAEELDVSHEGLSLLLAVKGPIPAAGIGLHLLPARDCEKPWLHPDIHPEDLGLS